MLVSGVLRIYRRHRSTCPQTSEKYRRCSCPIYVGGSLRGERIKKALDLTSWEAATELISKWSISGEIGVVKNEAPELPEAVKSFLDDCEARKLNWETMRKYRSFLEGRMLTWCASKGIRQLRHMDVETLRLFRASWDDGALYATKNLERLRAFFRFCNQAGWIKTNPATSVKPPKASHAPTLPFTPDEMEKILKACDSYRGDQTRIKAFILVMRYSGLRIGDTIALKQECVKDNKIRLRTAKTGTPVYVPIPEFVTAELSKLPEGEYYFWTGKGLRSAVGNWSRYLARVFEIAGIEDAHSHRFRDTFSTSLLEKGVPVETVAILLGNTPAIVMKHYAPFVLSRQASLEAAVLKALA